jgi:hypothetical protein
LSFDSAIELRAKAKAKKRRGEFLVGYLRAARQCFNHALPEYRRAQELREKRWNRRNYLQTFPRAPP